MFVVVVHVTFLLHSVIFEGDPTQNGYGGNEKVSEEREREMTTFKDVKRFKG